MRAGTLVRESMPLIYCPCPWAHTTNSLVHVIITRFQERELTLLATLLVLRNTRSSRLRVAQFLTASLRFKFLDLQWTEEEFAVVGNKKRQICIWSEVKFMPRNCSSPPVYILNTVEFDTLWPQPPFSPGMIILEKIFGDCPLSSFTFDIWGNRWTNTHFSLNW